MGVAAPGGPSERHGTGAGRSRALGAGPTGGRGARILAENRFEGGRPSIDPIAPGIAAGPRA